jgi:hypothetical protein
MLTPLLALALGLGGQTPPKVGDPSPQVILRSLDSEETFDISQNFRKRSTVLVFGSCT